MVAEHKAPRREPGGPDTGNAIMVAGHRRVLHNSRSVATAEDATLIPGTDGIAIVGT
jgi:hypothetical protein